MPPRSGSPLSLILLSLRILIHIILQVILLIRSDDEESGDDSRTQQHATASKGAQHQVSARNTNQHQASAIGCKLQHHQPTDPATSLPVALGIGFSSGPLGAVWALLGRL